MSTGSAIETLVRLRVEALAARDRRRPSARPAARHDTTALMMERHDGSCTVLWAGAWRFFSSRCEQWPTREAAMQAVSRVTGEILIWSEMAPQTWSARVA
jgi:hypothetical protein